MNSLLLLCCLSLTMACKSSAQSASEEINRQVWSPFIQAYNALDAEAFMNVHTTDVIRVIRDSKEIRVGEEYAKSMRASAERNRARGTVRSIELSFTERIHTDQYGFEVGYYKVVSASGGQQRVSYGKFHVVLKKDDDRWKILLDSDTSMDNSITEEQFLQGEVLTH
ncbi:MAG: nuclear transport factor 2 family protein [Saprospiraceae bacterium]|nr:nuclear transport factor 2 family protein [Saprospiraceae bacterium]